MAEKPYYLLDTFAERAKARAKAEGAEASTKAVDTEDVEVEDKAVKPAKKTTKRKS